MENKEVINYINGLLRKELCALPTHFDKEADGEVYDSIEDAEMIVAVSKKIESALNKLEEITDILDDTDFKNAESLNEVGEDKGYFEAICAVSVALDGKWRWI